MALRILLSNDDGWFAPGLQAMRAALAPLGEVTVVAPSANSSGASSSLTFSRPLSVDEISPGVFSVNGTPADCVHLALTGLLPFTPDLVVAGVNGGPNLGDDTLYSGTAAAAREGFLAGIDAAAVSQTARGWHHIEDAARAAAQIIRTMISRPDRSRPLFWNINVPQLPAAEIGPAEVTRLGRRGRPGACVPVTTPRSLRLLWIGPSGAPADCAEDTDFAAVAAGRISVTPLGADFTARDELSEAGRLLGACAFRSQQS